MIASKPCMPITNRDTFLCVRAGDALHAVLLPGIEVVSLSWVDDAHCRMLLQGPIERMHAIDALPASNGAGETFMLELRANKCGDHASLSELDVIVLTMTGCVVSYKYIAWPVIYAPPIAALVMRASIIGKLTLMDLGAHS